MRELSLFTGAGGGLLGTHLLGWEPVGYVEWNDYCQRVIAARIRDGILPDAPIFGNIDTFLSEGYAAAYQGMVDVVTGGFPCQPFSTAGKRKGSADERNKWPATLGCLRLVRPEWALLENVPGLVTSGYFGTILGDLAESGFDCQWRILSAAEMGAPHKRDRLWIVAHANSARLSRSDSVQSGGNQHRNNTPPEQSGEHKPGVTVSDSEDVADTESVGQREPADETDALADGRQARHEPGYGGQHAPHSNEPGLAQRQGGETKRGARSTLDGRSWWAVEPDVGRTLDGLARWLDFPESH